MRSKPTRARQTASATSQHPEERGTSGPINLAQEVLQRTAHLNSKIELVARQLQGAYLRDRGQFHDLADLVDQVRQRALLAMDKHPLDLPEADQIFGDPNAEPRTRLFNSSLAPDIERIAKELQAKWQHPGVWYNLPQIVEHVRKRALDVLNMHPDDVHDAYRELANPKVPPAPKYPNYVLAQNCVPTKVLIRLAPNGTDFMPARALVIADPMLGWSQVRALALRKIKRTADGGTVETLTPMTAPSDKELLKAAAAMNLRVRGKDWLLSPKRPAQT